MSVHMCVSVCLWGHGGGGEGVAACPSDKAYGAGPVLPGQSHIQIRADNIHWKNCCRLDTTSAGTMLLLCVCVCLLQQL